MENIKIKKPHGYKSSRIVYDQKALLVINLDYTVFQQHIEIGDNINEYEIVTDIGDEIIIKEIH